MTVSSQIRAEIESFATRLSVIARQEGLQDAMKALSAIGGPTTGKVHRTNGSNGHGKRAVTGKTGQKRDPEALASLVNATGEYIKANPGQGVEQIGPGLKIGTAALALPIKKLLAAKLISRKGQKRATKYFPSAPKK